uniref:PPPDE domain-containing protein n=1 Tax=Physcomitrium patens TaxID=3218 RepID=A0A2K1JT67_PHYPA|nr:hypothetical protein PHYPA_014446 [Physcomitrium patens]
MEEDGEKVYLYIYDLSQGMARQLSTTFLGHSIEGVWHSGIGFSGKYFYGASIQSVRIGHSPFGTPVEVLELGYTHIPKNIFEVFLQEIGPRYTMETYSLLNHNCNHFTDEAAQFLVGTGIPHHILRQVDVALNNPLGAMMLPMLQQLETTLRQGGVPVAPANNATGSPSMPNSSVPASSVSLSNGLLPLFPALFPPVATSAASPAVPGTHSDPSPPTGTGQSGADNERQRNIDKNREA